MSNPQGRPSLVVLEEFFDREDDRFLEQLRGVASPKPLGALADRWKNDPRPWARRQLLSYLDLPWDRVGHHPVIKRLFKHAEGQRDDELMAAFFVGCDRLVRRQRKQRRQYDWNTRETWDEEYLVLPKDAVPHEPTRSVRNPFTGEQLELAQSAPHNGRLFSYHTRYYLRRRVWRYFRRMGHQRPGDYCAAVGAALARFVDEDLSRGEHILDCWSLMHACFARHEAIEFTTTQCRLRPERRLAELSPAPAFLELWQRPVARDVLLWLVEDASARLVRTWAVEMLRREHAADLAQVAVTRIRALLDHRHSDVQQFGAELFESAAGLAELPVSAWIELLGIRNPTALETIGRLFAVHVAAEELSLAECVELACAEPVPVARLGLQFLSSKDAASEDDRALFAGLSEARCAALGGEVARLGLKVVGSPEVYHRDRVLAFLDSPTAEVREAAWEWLTQSQSGLHDSTLWTRLLETPYDDLRLRLIDHLEAGTEAPVISGDELRPVWSAVLAGVHRGGRQKLKAVRQLTRVLVEHPEWFESLLPVLAVALRSVRAPESREALSAIVTLATRHPELEEAIARAVPELKLRVMQ